jgi:uncharacterized protein (DUF1778 family)
MATETATIRVTRETRDLLAEQARARGVSLSAMLSALAHRAARDAALEAEREASRADAADSAVSAEERDWESAAADGIA